jgi:hypothetical protein
VALKIFMSKKKKKEKKKKKKELPHDQLRHFFHYQFCLCC